MNVRLFSVKARLFAGVAVAIVGTTGLLVVAAQPAGATNAWGTYHWARTANPFTLTVVDRLTTGEWKGYLGTTLTDWSTSPVMDLVSSAAGRGCKGVSGKIVACNGKFGFNGWLGLAQIWLSGSHITQGVAKMNDNYFNTTTYNDPDAKLHVLCQELGHAFGLDHQHDATSNSCMDDVNGLFDPAFARPNQHDYDMLGSMYAHPDGSSTISFSRNGATQFGLDSVPATTGESDDADWGRPVAFGPDGQPYLYEKGLGGEAKRYTFVYWAPRGNPGR